MGVLNKINTTFQDLSDARHYIQARGCGKPTLSFINFTEQMKLRYPDDKEFYEEMKLAYIREVYGE